MYKFSIEEIPFIPAGTLLYPIRDKPLQKRDRNRGLLNSGTSNGLLMCSISYASKNNFTASYVASSKPLCSHFINPAELTVSVGNI